VADDAPQLPATIIKVLAGDTIVEPDGSYTTIFHAEVVATNESAAHSIAQYKIEYSESMETAEILEAFTRKAAGKILTVDPTQMFAQAPPRRAARADVHRPQAEGDRLPRRQRR